MLQTENINELFHCLEEITTSKRPESIFQISPKMKRLENRFILASAASFTLLVALAWRSNSHPLGGCISIIFILSYILTILLSFIYSLLSIYNTALPLWKIRKTPFFVILKNLQHDLLKDAEPLHRLLAFDRKLLEYGLIQYRHCWSTFNNRLVTVFGGPLQLRLLPVLVTGLAAALNPTNQGGIYAWLVFICVTFLSLFTLTMAVRGERPQQVISLLEYAIRLKTAEPQNEPVSSGHKSPETAPPVMARATP